MLLTIEHNGTVSPENCPVPLSSPQITFGLVWDWIRNSAVRCRRLSQSKNFAVDAAVLNNQLVWPEDTFVFNVSLSVYLFLEQNWKFVRWVRTTVDTPLYRQTSVLPSWRQFVRWVRTTVDTPLYRQTSGLPSWRQFLFPSFISCFTLPLILFPSSRFFWLCKSEIGKDVLTVVVVLVLRVWYTDICQLVHWSGLRAKHSSLWPVRIRRNTFLSLEAMIVTEYIWQCPPTI